MKRELAGLNPQEAFDWKVAQKEDVFRALEREHISRPIALQLLANIDENYNQYISAWTQGLVGKGA